ncbi:SHOCT domain-containing protein [Blastococcus sp. URHD0036]|uniref:SHOCT domain-containing protein n=1 Tax=Blastococcus sp. URHD0036 TaxID=1380356 RepID=UPI0004976E31|nr:SHOCT domain-containing protein [Blastococcus sp. URHD0036]
MRRFLAGLLVLISAVTLVLASTSLWTRRNVINTGVFVSNVQEIVDLQEVEARITERVTDTVMTNAEVQQAIEDGVDALPDGLQRFRGTVETGVRSLIVAGVTRLLADDPFRPLATAAITSVHDQLVAGESLEFTLGQAKDRVPDSLRDGLAGQVLELLPDDVGVTLLSPEKTPQVYDAVDLLKSVWWWFGLVAVAALAGALGTSRRRRGTLRAWGITTAVLACLVLITLRIARGRIIVAAKPDNRDAVGAIYDSIAGSLRMWTLWLVGFALLVVVLTLVWGRLGLVAGMRHAAGAARRQLEARRAAAAAAAPAVDGAPGGATVAAADVPEESWPRRVAVGTRAFVDSLDLHARAAGLGTAVRAHHSPARWTGIALGALLLLLWPDPTLSVLIWVVALVAAYLWALDWLRDQAPVEEPATGPLPALATDGAGTFPALPVARPAPNGDSDAGAPHALSADPLTPAAISALNDRLDLLVRLGAAHDSGVLTDAEFDREKSRLMGV